MQHCKQVLRELDADLKAHERLICVSTRVIEAGIDISFGLVIRLSASFTCRTKGWGRFDSLLPCLFLQSAKGFL